MTVTLKQTVRKKYRRVMWIDGVSVKITANTITVNHPDKSITMGLCSQVQRWLEDGMYEGTYRGRHSQ
jgi:lactam utilization protein B